MMSSRLDCPQEYLSQEDIDAFLHAGVSVMSLARPLGVRVAFGDIAADGRFEPDLRRDRWFVFDEVEADDVVFWQRRTGQLTTWSGRVFALGQAIIDDTATYSFDCSLNIFEDPLGWLRSRRDGIVVLDWTRAFDRLRDAPRIALAENLLALYRHHMRPAHMPELSIIPAKRRAA